MKLRKPLLVLTIGLAGAFWVAVQMSRGQAPQGATPQGAAAQPPHKEFEDWDKVLAESEKFPGVFNLYRKKERLFLEVGGHQLEKPYLFLMAIARGIGAGEVLGGMTLDDWLITFRRVGDRVHIVRKNVRFRADPGSPTAEAVKLAYTDSVLAALRIESIRGGSILVDITDFLMSDIAEIGTGLRMALNGFYTFDRTKSSLGKIKNFPLNSEIEINAAYSGGPYRELDTVPDSRNVTVVVHYSLTALPETGYQPRLADDRIGYFLSAVKDYSKPADDNSFVRYIHRWHLEKADRKLAKSTPKQPIIFYIEKTVPHQYRPYVREGILEWNKAFEKAGFIDAIEVRQQPNDADWDPEDVRYNTFRWITASANFAMGPSRVNPLTGQIFDADIIFDADMIRAWQTEWDISHDPKRVEEGGWNERRSRMIGCDLMAGRARDLAFGASVALLRGASPDGKVPEELIGQAIKETVMHEVGHTLGLRHNFKGSNLWKPEELHDTNKTHAKGLSGSVMDYNPVNIAPKGVGQGDYYSSTIGPYDYWAIEYGYKPLDGGTDGEVAKLKEIASRSAERELAYATDEDTRGQLDPDPFTNRWDMGSDPLAYARRQADLIEELWQGKLVERSTHNGDGYQRARQIFGMLLGHYQMSLQFAARYVGGEEFHRSHRGDPNAKAPFEVTPAAKQREALEFLKQRAFSDKAFNFSPELLNSLAPERWMHWGMDRAMIGRLDYPIHERVLSIQARALAQLYSPLTLARVLDNERKCPAGDNCLTLPELFTDVSNAIWSELDVKADAKPGNNHQPLISGFRRGLQREHLKSLINLTLRPSPGTPEDSRTLAWSALKKLDQRIDNVLKQQDGKLDDYTRAHLEESQMRIKKALDASYQQGG